jgi:tetratricopeptide (TPR) repeat protein
MHIPRFYIVQYLKLTAIAAVIFAVVVSRSPESGAIVFGIFLLIAFAPLYLPLLPKSPESVLLHLPEDPDEQIAVLERAIARPVLFRSGPKRAVRIKLMQLYRERGRFKHAAALGSEILAQFGMSKSLESLIRLEMGICLNRLGRESDARAQIHILSQRLIAPPGDALGWLVQGRFFDTGQCYDQAIASYEHILSMPFFERKAIQNETCLRLALACVKAGRAQEAIRWAELALCQDSSRSRRCLLHQAAGQANAMLGRADQEEHHNRRADELANGANERRWLVDSPTALAE